MHLLCHVLITPAVFLILKISRSWEFWNCEAEVKERLRTAGQYQCSLLNQGPSFPAAADYREIFD